MVSNMKNYREKTNLQVLNNSLQGYEQQIIRNCLAFCAWSETLKDTMLQEQAKGVIEARGVDKGVKTNTILNSEV